MDNAFATARRALRVAEEEYNRLGEMNVSMMARRTEALEREAILRAQKDEAAEAANEEMEGQIAVMRAQHVKWVKTMDQECTESCSKSRDYREELDGLIADNDNERRKLEPKIGPENAPTRRTRTSRSSLATDSAGNEGRSSVTNQDENTKSDSQNGSDEDPAKYEESSIQSSQASETIIVSTSSTAALRSRSTRAPDTSQSAGWEYQAAPSSTRKIPLPDFTYHLPEVLPNYDNPEDMDSFSSQFSLVIAFDGQWHELRCSAEGCNANAPNGPGHIGFFNGVKPLQIHIRSAHKGHAIDLRQCIVRSFDAVDVKRMQEGRDPLSGPITREMYKKKKQPLGYSQVHPTGNEETLGGVKHARNASDSPVARAAPSTWADTALREHDTLENALTLGRSGGPPLHLTPPSAQMVAPFAASEGQQREDETNG